jgi:hypothetical protein
MKEYVRNGVALKEPITSSTLLILESNLVAKLSYSLSVFKMALKNTENENKICFRIPLEIYISRLRLRSNSFHIFRIILNVAFYIGMSPIKILSNEMQTLRISKLTKRRKV